MLKRVSTLTVFVLIVTVILANSTFANQDIKMQIEGKIISFEQKPFGEKGRVMVPLKEFSEKLGAEVTWDSKTDTAWVNTEYVQVEVPIGKDKIFIHRPYDFSGIPQEVKMDVPTKSIKNRTYIAVKYIAEALDMKVEWDGKSKTVIVSKQNDGLDEEKPLDIKNLTFENIKDDAELSKWYEESYKTKGTHYKRSGSNVYLLVSAGEKATGGYSVKINNVVLTQPDTAKVYAVLESPAPDALVTQAITYPHALISIENENIKHVEGEMKERKTNLR